MSSARTTSSALAVLALLTGCGGPDAPGSAARPGAGTADGPPAGPAEPAPPAEPKLVEMSVPWRLAGADGTLLEIRVAGAGCVSYQNVDITETARAVTIAAKALHDVTPGRFCSQEVSTEQAPTSLDNPLGTRRLVHAAVSPAWPGPDSIGADAR